MYTCPNCGGALRFDIPSQQLACVQCASHFDPYSITKESDAEADQYYEATVFKCPQCGGEVLSTDNTAANFCTFCGASTILTQNLRKEKKPGYIIPFTKTKEDCKKAYSKFMRHAWFAPKELKDARYIDGFRGIYMPYWAYHITEKGPICLSGTRSFRRGDYVITEHYNLTGDINSSYKGISYDASSSFDDTLSASIAPFDVKNMNRFTPSYLCGFYADTADVDSKVYERDAKHIAASQTYNFIRNHPDTDKFTLDEPESFVETKLNPQCERADGAMFPVWFLSYRNRDRVAYATVNGQTGKVAADMPVSIGKYLFSSFILAIPIFLLLNAMFTLIPTVSLAVSSIIASVVPFLFVMQLKQIIRKDEGDFKINTTANSTTVQRSVKSGSGMLPVAAVFLAAYVIIMFGYTAVSSESTSTCILVTFIATLLGIIGFFCSLSPHRKVAGKHFSKTLYPCITLVIATAIQIIAPVSDIFYYAGIILNLIAVLGMLISLIKYYNVLATRRLPQFTNYRGGDDRA